jgi:WD40 repeat protein
LAMSPTSSQIAVTTGEGVTVVNAATGAIDATLTVPWLGLEGVTWIGQSKLGVRHSGQVSVVDIDTGPSPDAVSTPVSANAAIASDDSGGRLAIGPGPHEKSTVRIVDTATGAATRFLTIPTGQVTDLSFQPGGDLLAIGTADAGLYVLDAATGATVLSRATPLGESGRFSPDGTKLAIHDGAGTVTVIDPTTGAVLLPPVVQARQLRNVYFTPEADALVADAGSALVTITLDGREPLASAPFGEPGDQAGAVSADGNVAWAIRPPTDQLNLYQSVAYHPDDGRSTLTLAGLAFEYGPDDEWLYTWQNDGLDAVLDPRSGASLFTASPVGRRARASALDPRASMVVRATLDGQTVDVRRLPDLSVIETGLDSLPGEVLALAFNRDGRRIAVATAEPSSTTMIHILDIASGDDSIEPIRWTKESPAPRAIAFTADDRALLIGDQDGSISEIDVATGTVSPSRFESMHGPVVGLGSLPDGHVGAISHDGTMSIYDATSGQPIGPPMAWAPRVNLEQFDVPNVDIAVHHLLASDPHGLRLWNIDLSTWPAVACQRAGRNLTHDEWTRYMPADEPYRRTCPQFPAE